MITVSEMTACLEDALTHPERFASDVECFQHSVFEAPHREPGHAREWRELEELARDLAWYVADARLRGQYDEFMGPRRAIRRIREGLAKLDATPARG